MPRLRCGTSWNKNLFAGAGSDIGKRRLEDGRNSAVVSLRRYCSVLSLHLQHDVDLIAVDNDPLDGLPDDGADFRVPDARAGIGGQIVAGQRASEGFDHNPLYVIGSDMEHRICFLSAVLH